MPRISVYVRIRPTLANQTCEDSIIQKAQINQDNNSISVVLSQKRQKVFKFQGIINEQNSQQQVYNKIQMQKLVNRVVQGYHSTIFAYGQTGSGKTFTIEGPNNSQNMGLIPRSIRNLFRLIRQRENTGFTYKVYLSFLQIYNQQIFDLIDLSKKPLKMRWNKYQQFVVQNLFEGQCRNQQEAIQWWKQGQKSKIIDSHNMNSQSSRSHCILTLRVRCYELEDPSNSVQSKLEIVDLAGSQRQKVTKSSGIVFREGIQINKSLFALRQVISSLYESNIGSKSLSLPPYRDSKLTSLLKQSIGGNAYCAMIACLNPTLSHYQQSIQTLTYASMASYISNIPSKNIDPKIKQNQILKQQNYNLKQQIKKLSYHITYLTNLLQKTTCTKCGSMNSVDLTDLDERLSALTRINYYNRKSSQFEKDNSNNNKMSMNSININNINDDIKLPKFNIPQSNRIGKLSKKISQNKNSSNNMNNMNIDTNYNSSSNNQTQTKYFRHKTQQRQQQRSFSINPSSPYQQIQLKNPKQVLQSITMIRDLINSNTKLRDKIQFMREQAEKMEKQTYQIIQENQLLRDRWEMLGSNLKIEGGNVIDDLNLIDNNNNNNNNNNTDNESPISLYQRLIRQQRGQALILSKNQSFHNTTLGNRRKTNSILNQAQTESSQIIQSQQKNAYIQYKSYNQILRMNSNKNKKSNSKSLLNKKKKILGNKNKDGQFVY